MKKKINNSNITEMRHVGIVVNNLQKNLDFFVNVLGFRIFKKMNEKGKYIDSILNLKKADVITVKIKAPDSSLIELLKFKNYRTLNNSKKIYTNGLTHISFTVKDLEKAFKFLKKKKIKFYSTPQVTPDGSAKVVFCRGPENLILELVQVLKI
jgi:catechol-2,3-dioxygenase